MEQKLLTTKEVAAKLRISLPTLYKSIKQNSAFPGPVNITKNKRLWLESDIENFINTKPANKEN